MKTTVTTANPLRSLVMGARLLALVACLGLCTLQPVSADLTYAWGLNNEGELGTPTHNDVHTPERLSKLPSVVQVATGLYHNLALTSAGEVWSWGPNEYGQVGNGTIGGASETPIHVLNLHHIVAVSAGQYFSVALRKDGTVWAWGQNSLAQLGNGTLVNSGSPVQVTGLTNVVAIAAGGYHVLALKSDGTLWGWGNNYEGETGNGTTSDYVLAPAHVVDPSDKTGYLTGVTAIAGGEVHSMVLKSDGTVRTWGYNGYGELGDGTTYNSSTPIVVPKLKHVIMISGGEHHSLALQQGGKVLAWGSNSNGQLGDGSGSDSSSPVAVSGSTSYVAISAGYAQSLGLASDGTVWAWGSNDHGQLGDGTTTGSSVPIKVHSLAHAVAVASGGYHSLALR
jgi:hypothetical protein